MLPTRRREKGNICATTQSIKETVTVIMQGKIRMSGHPGYAEQPVSLIEGNGRTCAPCIEGRVLTTPFPDKGENIKKK
jgi:hypothetical protein